MFSIGVSHSGATQVELNYGGAWHVKSGSSASWSLSENDPGDTTYWGNAYVNGQWISDGTDTCVVTITQPVDHPGTMTLTVTPSSIEYGQSFSITADYSDPDETSRITVYRGTTTIGSKTNCYGTTCTYSLTDTPSSSGQITYKATGRDVNDNPVSATKAVTITGATIPTVSLLVSPTTLTTGQTASFQVSASDAGNDLSQIKVFYGDGASATQSCSGGSCGKTWSHSYSASGTVNAYATVTDGQGHTATSQMVPVYVQAPSDADGDGVPDASDQCPSTPTAWRPVVTSGNYLGCACAEITAMIPDPTRDANACTDDSCSITASGAFQAVHTPFPDGSQPEGLSDGCQGSDWVDYACEAGAVANTTTPDDPRCVSCTPHASQVCWNNEGYWQDSCGNLEQPALVTCTAGETCQVVAGVASCAACQPSCDGKACGASDECGGTCDGTCATGTCTFNTTTGLYGCVAATPSCPASAAPGCWNAASLPHATLLPFTCAPSSLSCWNCSAGYLWNASQQACVVPACVDARSDAVVCGSWTCGSVADSCGVARPCGACATGQVCQAGTCVAQTLAVDLANDSVPAVIAGHYVRLHPILVDMNGHPVTVNAVFDATGWLNGRATNAWLLKQATATDVGLHTVQINATATVGLQEVPVPPTAFSIAINCDPADPAYGPCCQGTRYADDGTPCTYDNDPNGGTCQAGKCEKLCTTDPLNPALGCYHDRVYYYDNCGQRRDLHDDCIQKSEVCLENPARCATPPETCTRNYTYTCRGQEGIRIDQSCGKTVTLVTCAAPAQCSASPSGVACVTPACPPERPLQCGPRCVDPMTQRTDCGSCNNQCAATEQCVQGSCEPIPGCHVVCDKNTDCGEGYVCVYSGDCTRSECQPVDIITQNATDAAALAHELTTSGLLKVTATLAGNTFSFDAANLGADPLENVTVMVRFGKVIAGYASQLAVRDAPYDVLVEDPVLQFNLGTVAGEKLWSVSVPGKTLDPSYVNLLEVNATYGGKQDLLAAWNRTKDALRIGLNSEYDGNATTFHLTLSPDKRLGGLSVPIEIPKCLAQYAEELTLDGNYRIVKDDPLIVWQFEQLDQPTEITFSVPKEVDEDCKAQLRAMAVARTIGKPLNPWLSLLIIPIIGVLLIFFQRFTPEGARHERLSKEEFREIAKAQGHDEEEIERQWREYRRRF